MFENILKKLSNCSCGKEHLVYVKGIEFEENNVEKVNDILNKYNFPKNILIVCDKNTYLCTEGLINGLKDYKYSLKIYSSFKIPTIKKCNSILRLLKKYDGVLGIGSGTINDCLKYCSYILNKRFALFATACSMDGFVSDSAALVENCFKKSFYVKPAEIIISDPNVLVKAPKKMIISGLGDMLAKYIAIADWKISKILINEYYCDNIVNLVRESIDVIVSSIKDIDKNKPINKEVVIKIFNGLILSGLAMGFTNCSRPASGAEHIISHFWESKKIAADKMSDLHGRKVAVATLAVIKRYKELVKQKVEFVEDRIDYELLKKVYGEKLIKDIVDINTNSVIDIVTPSLLEKNWGEIVNVIDELPNYEYFYNLYRKINLPKTYKNIKISEELYYDGINYSCYMRNRITLLRLSKMIKPIYLDRIDQQNDVIVAGHRGAKALYPENTMLSFKKAINMGVDMIETDLSLTKDGYVVMIHDATVDRTTNGKGMVNEFTLEEIEKLDAGLGERIPLFDNFCKMISERYPYILLNIEIKDKRYITVDKTVEIIDRYNLRNNCVIACFDAKIIEYAFNVHKFRTQGFISFVMKNFNEKTYSTMYAAGIDMKLLTNENITEIKEKGIIPWSYCPDTYNDVMYSLNKKILLMTCNNPIPALKKLNKYSK